MSECLPDIARIREAARVYKIRFQKHALQRANEKDVSFEDIRSVIVNGEVIETYPSAFPLPKCLIVGMVKDQIPLYVSVAYDEKIERVRVITVHWQDPEKWINYQTRKPKSK